METAAIIGATTALIVALAKIWLDLREVHKTMNSRLDELLEATKKVAFNAGVKQEQGDAVERGKLPPHG